jgi:hypothetical protein
VTQEIGRNICKKGKISNARDEAEREFGSRQNIEKRQIKYLNITYKMGKRMEDMKRMKYIHENVSVLTLREKLF